MRKLLAFLCWIVGVAAHAQDRSVAITIDDVPNVHLYAAEGNSSRLLTRLDSLGIPVAIFINEGILKQNAAFETNKKLLQTWIAKPFVTVGNHSYSHPNLGEASLDTFRDEVLKGEEQSRQMADHAGKKLEYFRFPYNAIGQDSAAQVQREHFLTQHHYISTPFTVESEDWLFTQLYEQALSQGKQDEARSIANRYVDLSLQRFEYFENLGRTIAGHAVKQIYLCHDNRLNTDYLPVLIQKLKEKQYRLISLEEAMTDPAYELPLHYHGNFGCSWMYRWVKDPARRRTLMQSEPADSQAQEAYETLTKAKK